MKKEKKVWAMTVLIAFWWLAPNQTNAQQDSTSTTSLDAVVITATKFAKSQTETGKVLTVIDENQIRQSAGKDLSQLLNEQVGLFINGANSNPGKDKAVYLRGAKSDYTLVLLDGVPLNDPSSIGGGAYDFRLIPMDQIERIEILKGNQSTLYGSNAMAGVINIITKKDGDKKVDARALISYGSFNTFKSSANVSGAAKKFSYLVGATHLSTDGVSEARDTVKSARFEKDGFTQNTFNASFTLKPVKGFQIEPYVRYSEFDGKYDDGAFQDNAGNFYKSSFHNIGATTRYDFSIGSIQFFYAYDKTDRRFTDSYGSYPFKGLFHQGETFFNYRFNQKFELLAGVSAQKWHMLDDAAAEKNPSITLVSPYASLFFRNLNGFSAEVGGRFNQHAKYGNNFTYSFNPSYRVKSVAKIFVNVSTGFKAPSLQQLYGQYSANKDLKPETSFGSEAGIQFFLKKKIDIRVVAFQRRIDDIIISVYPKPYLNLNQQKDKGIDVETSLSVNNKLRTKAFYSYVIGRTIVKDGMDNENLYRIPKNSFGLNVQYQALPNWLMSVNYKLTGTRTDLFYNSATFNNEEATLSAIHLLDFYTEYSLLNDRLKVFIDVKNLLNQFYYEVYGYSTLPINIQSGVSARL